MGSGSSKTHESFTVSPSLATPVSQEDIDAAWAEIYAVEALYNTAHAMDVEEALAGYGAFCEQVAAARQAIDHMAEIGAADSTVVAAEQHLDHAVKQWLNAVEPDGLAALAAQHGFEHPTLVGYQALQRWLNPLVSDTGVSKPAIELKASERYDLLAAGGTINGKTLADVQAHEAALGITAPAPAPGSWPTWDATPADIVAHQAALAQALGDLPKPKYGNFKFAVVTPEQLASVLEHENRLATASCPELGDQMEVVVAASRHNVTAQLDPLAASASMKPVLSEQLNAAAADGHLPPGLSAMVNQHEALQLLRASTPQAERLAVVAACGERAAALMDLTDASAVYSTYKPDPYAVPKLPALDEPNGAAGVTAFVQAAGTVHQLHPKIKAEWGLQALEPPVKSWLQDPKSMSSQFRAWAKNQKLGDLRDVASSMGLEHAPKATRVQVQNWLAGHWDPSLNKAAIAAQITTPKPPKAPPAPAPAPPVAAPTASPAAPSPAGNPSAPGSPRSWAAKHQALVGALKHHAASVAELPERVPAAEVANWTFTPSAAPVALGGAHTKSLYTAPNGSTWMFKPDNKAGGARAHAEAAASSIFARVGVPAVPVYAHTVGAQTGCIQPLVGGATNLQPNPKSWSQSDVDAMVRYHVAAWAVGDHDGKPDNILRTSGGGLVPVDGGQAFKFFGRDRLDASYHPNASFGASPPVFHQAYKAAGGGQLGSGVTVRPEAALGVIKAFEAIPDSDYRTLLHAAAHHGAGHSGVEWGDPMRKRAAKQLGKPAASVTTGEIAEAFLSHAVERKNSLRASFASFFAALGVTGADKLTKVT